MGRVCSKKALIPVCYEGFNNRGRVSCAYVTTVRQPRYLGPTSQSEITVVWTQFRPLFSLKDIKALSYLDWSPDSLSAGRDAGRTLSSSHSANEPIEAQKRSALSQGCTAWVRIPGLPLSSGTWESYLFASVSSSSDDSNTTCLIELIHVKNLSVQEAFHCM